MQEIVQEIYSEVDLRNISADHYPERVDVEDLSSDAGDHLARYAFATHWVPGHRVVDVCCGMGYGTNLLAAAGAIRVHGIDLEAAVIEETKRRYTSPAIEFLCADVTVGLPIPEVDVAVCFEGIEHVPSAEALLANIVSCLAAHGVALISTPNAASFIGGHSGNPYHLHEFRLDEFEGLLKQYFYKVKIFFQRNFDDPYDFQWNLKNIIRVLTPIPIKHSLRSILRRHRLVDEPSINPYHLGHAAKYRPLPISYLSLPGLKAEPRMWLAVCEGPRKTI